MDVRRNYEEVSGVRGKGGGVPCVSEVHGPETYWADLYGGGGSKDCGQLV
jgi:hypothetical protein